MKKILVFTGAGFPAALGLPTTTEFRKTIDTFCTGEFRIALEGHLESKFYDIETILSTLEFFVHKKSFLKFLLAYPKQTHSYFAQYKEVRNQVDIHKKEAKNLIFELKKSLFNTLNKFETSDSCSLYSKLLMQIINDHENPAISIFTTNYDLTFERAIDEMDDFLFKNGITDINTGFKQRRKKTYFDPKIQYTWDKTIIEYKKLHGSLNWMLVDNKVVENSGVVDPSDPDKILLLYPGFKGTPDNEPYKTFHDDLLLRLLDADVVYVIGFAFRDEYINNHFDTALKINKNLKILCYNPTLAENLPSESQLKFFVDKYDSKFKHVNFAIRTKENPLSIDDSCKIIKYLTWGEAQWQASLNNLQQPKRTITTSSDTTFEIYDPIILHTGGDIHTDDHIDYISSSKEELRAYPKAILDIDNNTISFTFLVQKGDESATQKPSKCIQFIDWDGQAYEASIEPIPLNWAIKETALVFICKRI